MRWIAETKRPKPEEAAGSALSGPSVAEAVGEASEIRRIEATAAAESALHAGEEAKRLEVPAETGERRQPKLHVRTAEPAERTTHDAAAEVAGLRLKFPGVPDLLFRDLSLSIRQGEKVLLLGPSGCGKSTLLQVLGGVIPRVTEVPLKADRLKVPDSAGMVFQDPDTQFCMPYVDEELAFVLENLAVPREDMRARIEAALLEVGLHLPDIHMPIGSLSQGMKQRLALASVLLLEPDTLLLDEPSALLDPEGRRAIWAAVRRVSEQRTVIVVEHRIDEVLDWMDRVIVFRGDGSVLADGPAAEVFRLYRAELREYGIWYPGAWEDALAVGRGDAARPEAAGAPELPAGAAASAASCPASAAPHGTSENAAVSEKPHPANRASKQPPVARGAFSEPLLRLENFRVLRGGRAVCAVDRAAVMPGDLIALTGPNGAGKSSLLLGLMGLLPRQGECRFGTDDPAGRREERQAAAKHAAFVFQNPEFQFVTDRVLDEVAFTLRGEAAAAAQAGEDSGRRGAAARLLARWSPREKRRRARLAAQAEPEIARRAADCLARFGLGGYEDRHPYLLSLGQKRRLSVASSVVTNKPLLLLDEPTFGQDARNAFAMLRLCDELRAAGHAILMITHEPEIAELLATQVWQIEDGRLKSASPTGRSRSDGIRLREEATAR
ncbi:ABC transporter [Saccharibacillus sp. O23]|uniref:ABC transporter ATP-binding protein n=1 Tax=Saccharibacillus sp. O23 TaxID=2009338 RepID=UPI000B4E500F|nr:ABC transporter ATP-binding protein [Saccharibacillus sp. O23]OWR30462.1 ABC transporter [Saccharibacillus sp. O23]